MASDNRPQTRTRRIVGLALIAISAVSLLTIPPALEFWGAIDFPCFGNGSDPSEQVEQTSQLAYCLSWLPLNYSGGGIYASGATTDNDVRISQSPFWHGTIDLERQEETVIANGRSLSKGESTSFFRFFPSLNP